MLRILRDAGFKQGPALSAAGVASNFVVGFAVDLQALEAAKRRGGVLASFRSIKEQIDPAEYPLVAEIDEKMVAKMIGARDIRARFDFGLQVILRGLGAVDRAAYAAPSRSLEVATERHRPPPLRP